MKKRGVDKLALVTAVLTAVVALLFVAVGVLWVRPVPEPGVVAEDVSNMSGPLDLTGAGTAAAPALYLAGDSDTGIYRSAANNWDVATGGTRRLNVSSTGLDLVSGDITMANGEILSNYTDGVISTTAQLGFLLWISDTANSTTLTAAESGVLVTNDGASGLTYVTLPDSAAGLYYGVLAQDDYDIRIEPSVTQQILDCTNAAGDACVVDDQYECVWLVGDGTGWLVERQKGTPADGD